MTVKFRHSFLSVLSVVIVTMLTQILIPGRAACPTDVPFPSDRGNRPDPQLPSDPHLMPTERCGELNPCGNMMERGLMC